MKIKAAILNLPGNADREELHYLQLLSFHMKVFTAPKRKKNQTGLNDFLAFETGYYFKKGKSRNRNLLSNEMYNTNMRFHTTPAGYRSNSSG